MGNHDRRNLMIVAVTLSALVVVGNYFHEQSGLASPGGNPMNDSRFTVDHVRLTTDKPFEDVAKAFERQLGKFDPEVYKSLTAGGGCRGSQGEDRSDGGAERLHAVQHAATMGRCCVSPAKRGRRSSIVVGNPLFALQMTQHDIRASLYAPLRVLIYENEEGKTCVEYDKPSSLFGQFGNPEVTDVAIMLDGKLEQLVAKADAL